MRQEEEDEGQRCVGVLQTLAGLVRAAAGQRAALADERQHGVAQHGGGQPGRLQQSVHRNLLRRRIENAASAR